MTPLRIALALGGAAALAAGTAIGVGYAQRADAPGVTRGERVVELPVGIESAAAEAARVYPAGAVDRFAASPIPVLAPPTLSETQRTAFSDSFRAVPDGFFAVIPARGYDVVVNGTITYAIAPELIKVIDRGGARYLYEEGETGVSISFSRYGADYLLQFECTDPARAGEDNNCVDEDTVVATAESLSVIGGGGR